METFAYRAVVFTVIVVVIVTGAILFRYKEAVTTASGALTTSSALSLAPENSSSTEVNTEWSRTPFETAASWSTTDATKVPAILSVEVDTTAGKLKGGAVDIYGVKLHRWLGVPYSQIGARSKRFAFAQPVNASSRIALYAAEPSPPCAQVINDTLLGREDCLRMNVWAPAQQSTHSASRPLLLAMAQDWFSRGTNNLPEWETLAAKANAVVMSPNVRLGVLGFLGRTSPAEFDADLAIVDAMVAVSWALDNAAAFYADPSKLMLVGHGSGAYVLTAAAQALNLNCLRAVLEGPVPGSALPTNTDMVDTWEKLATVLGCRGDSEWESCLQEAQLSDLLADAANITFRFGPSWDTSKWLHTPAVLQVQEVVAGVDVDEVRAFFEERVRPWAVANGCAATVARLYDCALEYFTNWTAAYVSLLRAFEPKTETDIVQLLAMLMSGCDTYRIARGASKAGYHYITAGSGRTLFEPVLDVDALAAFLKDGRPPVRDGMTAWYPITTHESSRVVFPNGTDAMDSWTVPQACQIAFSTMPTEGSNISAYSVTFTRVT